MSQIIETDFQAIAVPFSIFKMVLLLAWIYSSLYIAQRTQFGTLVTRKNKNIATLFALFLGPLTISLLFVYDLLYQTSQNSLGLLDNLSEKIRQINIKSNDKKAPTRTIDIDIFDSSGREMEEILGRGKSSKDLRTLEFTQHIIVNAIQAGATDILIDPKDEMVSNIRYRIDGVLRTVDQIETTTCQAVINSIKAVANMDIAERRRPQDGAFSARIPRGNISFRAATAGVLNGEKLSVRVLDQDPSKFTLDTIGMSKKQRAITEHMIKKPTGMVLLCGPTGSGKTSTLFSMLNKIDITTRNVITVEDPVEYILPEASQIEVNPKADITFAKSLRSILRQDPDVICVGEIRDEETAKIALRAAQTGHLVFATIHSNSNASTIVRLLDLGVTPMTLAAGLNLLISQRLIRKLCENCKKPMEPTPKQIHTFKKNKINYKNAYQAVGCEKCGGTGYKGRIAIFDMLVFDKKLKNTIANNDIIIQKLRKNGDKKGKSNLYKQGLKMVVTGVTSYDELKRVVG